VPSLQSLFSVAPPPPSIACLPPLPPAPRVLQRSVSYKELPLRLADFSTLHRNEATGALGGLTRLRRFQQDDAHIFCSLAQVEAEVAGCLHFIAHVYRLFGFSFRAKLSTRPETYVGELATWQRAEAALATSLRQFLSAPPQQQAGDADAATASEHSRAPSGGQPGSSDPRTPAPASAAAGSDTAAPGPAAVEFEVDEGGGAFYGPKIDVFVRDAIGREHQCATVQLDFNLPQRFGLTYRDAEGGQTAPVMIHRAILGSVERMLGILIEHTAGRWPFWLSPRQVMVCSVNDRNVPYAEAVARELMAATATDSSGAGSQDRGASAAGPHGLYHPHANAESLFVDVDDSARTVPKKVREAQVAQYNVIAVVGDAEQAARTVTLRFRDAATVAAFTACAAEVHVAVPEAAAAPTGERAAAPTPKSPSKAAAAVAAPKDADVPPATIITLTVAEAKRVCEHMSRTLR
jgi:threonyl-tRNA synthetase